MLTDRKLRIAWRAYLTELGVVRMFERPSEAVIAERFRGYFHSRFVEALKELPTDSQKLAEVLTEMFALLVGEDEIEGWQPPALEEVLSRITEPLTSYTPAAKC